MNQRLGWVEVVETRLFGEQVLVLLAMALGLPQVLLLVGWRWVALVWEP